MTRAEDQLLLCCSTLYGGQAKSAHVHALLQHKIDWPFVIQMAQRHGVAPLLFWNLKGVGCNLVPEHIADELRRLFRANAIRNLLLTTQLLKILKLFQDQGILAVPYKGPTLSLVAYGDVALRQFSDLDLIVRKRDLLHAKDLLLSAGYQPQYLLTREEESAYLECEGEYNFDHPQIGAPVELHWKIVKKSLCPGLDTDEIWNHLEPLQLLDSEVKTISPQHLLLVLSVHGGGKHQWERLGWICDLANLVTNHPNMDWQEISGRAAETGTQRMLLLGLYLAKNMLAASLPDLMEKRIREEPSLKPLAADIRAGIFSTAQGSQENRKRLSFYLRMRERPADKLQYLVGRLFTSNVKDWALLKLPMPLFPLYRILRPFRLAGEFGGKLLARYSPDMF